MTPARAMKPAIARKPASAENTTTAETPKAGTPATAEPKEAQERTVR
jgi:hypothetical protein